MKAKHTFQYKVNISGHVTSHEYQKSCDITSVRVRQTSSCLQFSIYVCHQLIKACLACIPCALLCNNRSQLLMQLFISKLYSKVHDFLYYYYYLIMFL